MSLTRRNCGRGHTYTLDGEKAPAVTRILEMRAHPAFAGAAAKVTANYAVDNWDTLAALPVSERLERLRTAKSTVWGAAALRGTRLHGYAQRIARDEEIAADELTDEQDALVHSYVKFLDSTLADVVATELVVASRTPVRYCGTTDLVTDLPALVCAGERLPAARWLLDLKAGASGVWPDAALQCCAYSRAQVYLHAGAEVPLSDMGIERCGALHVRPDGWDLYPLDTGDEVWETFLRLAWMHEHANDDTAAMWVGAAVDPPALPLLTAGAAQRF